MSAASCACSPIMPEGEIARLEKLQGAELNDAKKILATEATAILHGREAAERAADTARRAFEEGAMAEGLPTIHAKLPDGILNLAVAAGLASIEFRSAQIDRQQRPQVERRDRQRSRA